MQIKKEEIRNKIKSAEDKLRELDKKHAELMIQFEPLRKKLSEIEAGRKYLNARIEKLSKMLSE
jgi:chromosome segregation ATPase